MTLKDKQQALIARLGGIANAQDRFIRVVEQGRARPPLDVSLKTDAHKVAGCLSNLWLVCEAREGQCYFQCDADSQIVKAVASLLCDFYSGYAAEEILTVDPSFLREVGITQHLTPNRRNALTRVWDTIRKFAESQR